jgi:UDP-N-acetylmuramoyl-tripeptide--D-alanyl-D-alanine ligase
MDTLYTIFSASKGISTDTREEVKDKVFFALKGEKFNGNKFAIQALSNGALCAVVDDEKIFENASPAHINKLFFVNNVIIALQELAYMHRNNFDIPVIAITGTNGKTTTKELTNLVLSKKYNVIATEGNLNNHIGVPLTLLRINNDTEMAITEMGANKKKDIELLCKIACPTHGVITNIGIAHLQGFKGKADIIKTKGELYQYINEKHGTIFVNKYDSVLTKLLQKIVSSRKTEIIKYGDEEVIDPKRPDRHVIEKFNVENMKAAKAIALYFKISEKTIKETFGEYKPQYMRSQRVVTKRNELILDAYNANPTSMRAAYDAFIQTENEKLKWIILGDMKELGERSHKEHAKLIRYVRELKIKNAVFIGKEFYKSKDLLKEYPKTFHFFKNKEDFRISSTIKTIVDSFVFIKGSRAMKMEEVVTYL